MLVSPTGCATVDRVHIDNITPKEFFDKYVAQRRPVVIEGYLQEETHAGNLHKWGSDKYLLDKAGDAQVSRLMNSSTTEGQNERRSKWRHAVWWGIP